MCLFSDVDPKSVTIAGFSSGGAQAMQFHISHSSKLLGAGIFSGGKMRNICTFSCMCALW